MSLLQYPDAINASDLQVWNNAAFDNGDSSLTKDSWCSLQPVFANRSETLDSQSGKENQSPVFCKSSVSVKSPIPIKPLNPNGATANLKDKPLKLLFKQGLLCPSSPTVSENGSEIVGDDRKIDLEIKEIEMEISQLASKLKALRLEKEEKNLNKIMEQKQRSKNSIAQKKMEQTPVENSSTKFRRRGVSLGPSEIIAGVRSQPTVKPGSTTTPIQSTQNHQKSCFWKLPEINEDKVTKQRGGRCLSLSPKSRLPLSKIQSSKQGFTTIGSKKSLKKVNGVLSSVIQPKKLFKEGEKSVSIKKPVRNGRIVASRYNQSPAQITGNHRSIEHRKRSLPENEKEDITRCDKKHASLVGKSNGFLQECNLNWVTESRGKKRWEIPSEIVIHENLEDNPLLSVSNLADLLPRIRTVRHTNETPRDSGPAKRVFESNGRKTHFIGHERGVGSSVCQALSFEEDE